MEGQKKRGERREGEHFEYTVVSRVQEMMETLFL